MEKKNKDILKKGLMETKMDFTSNLMDKINAEEKSLSMLLSKNGSLEAPKDFTEELMLKLEGKTPAKIYQPVISKSAWIGIAAIFSGVILLALLTIGQEASSGKYALPIDQLSNSFTFFFKYSPALTFICFSSLLLTLGLIYEQRIKKNRAK